VRFSPRPSGTASANRSGLDPLGLRYVIIRVQSHFDLSRAVVKDAMPVDRRRAELAVAVEGFLVIRLHRGGGAAGVVLEATRAAPHLAVHSP
jgi:hypothetical protein